MRQINIKVSDEEYDLINANAALLDKTITAYVKELALNQNIINYDFETLQKHTEEISNIKQVLNQIVIKMIQNGDIYSGDMNTILSVIQELTDSEKEIKSQLRKERESNRKYLKKCVQKNLLKLQEEKESA